ncbi:glycosyltransferase family 2 protein [uncultured Marinobacter sp.]|uniref:glycosyltransferase family 2 protein n=1 Tax=uncultured Marinobacter sp. TaxID=187379 RepID=UPI0030C8BB01
MKESEPELLEGGRRLQGTRKNNSGYPLVSVVTVVFNMRDSLANTLASVSRQTYPNIEYVVIDGGSTDGSLEVIRESEALIDYWRSEPDRGIYNAMNKAIDLVTGEWVLFMNAGDWFWSEDSIASIFSGLGHHELDVLFGDHEVRYSDGRQRLVKAGDVKDIWKGARFCHQSAFVRRDLQARKFREDLKIVADYEFFYRAWLDGYRFGHRDIVVASYEAGGVSDRKRLTSTIERWSVVKGGLRVHTYYGWRLLIEALKMVVKKGVGNFGQR